MGDGMAGGQRTWKQSAAAVLLTAAEARQRMSWMLARSFHACTSCVVKGLHLSSRHVSTAVPLALAVAVALVRASLACVFVSLI